MDASYETLFIDVLPYAPHCPEPVAVNAIRNAAIEFANSTLFLTEDFDAITVTANEAFYTVDPPAGYTVVQLVGKVYFNGRPLADGTPDMLKETAERMGQSWEQLVKPEPLGYLMHKADEIRLVPIPDGTVAGVLTGRMALAPTVTSTRADKSMLNDNRKAIAAGALADLLMIPNQPYTDPVRAEKYSKIFGAATANVAAAVRTSFVRAPMRVQFNRHW